MPNLCSNDTFELNSILKVRLKEQIPIFQLASPQNISSTKFDISYSSSNA